MAIQFKEPKDLTFTALKAYKERILENLETTRDQTEYVRLRTLLTAALDELEKRGEEIEPIKLYNGTSIIENENANTN